MLNTSQRMFAHYERQNNRPRIDKIKAFAEALEVPIEEIVTKGEEKASGGRFLQHHEGRESN